MLDPHSTVAVGYGEQSFEEMMLGFFEWVPAEGESAATTATRSEP